MTKNYTQEIIIKKLNISALIGPNVWGKLKSQPLLVDICLMGNFNCENDHLETSISYSLLAKTISDKVSEKSFKTIRHFSEFILNLCFSFSLVIKATVKVQKPLISAKSSGFEISKDKSEIEFFI